MLGMMVSAAVAVASQVTEVTVYNDRAQVVRTAEVELQPGVNPVRFEDLPERIDARGIQVEGSGAAVVQDVRFRVEALEEVPKAEWKALMEQEEALGREQDGVRKRIEAYRNARDFLSRISGRVTALETEEGGAELNPDTWRSLLEMNLERRLAYDAEIRALEAEFRRLDRKKEKVAADRKARGANLSRTRRVVEVDVEAAESGRAVLKLSYLVHGPGWTPSYDVRVDTENKRIDLKYYALVRQNTGEDWSHVAVRLSTANPGLGGEHPELQPWWIRDVMIRFAEGYRYRQDYDVESGQRTAPIITPEAWNAPSSQIQIDAKFADLRESEAAARDLGTRGATAGMQGTAVVFDVDGQSNIDSDNTEHRVTIGTRQLPAYFRYSTVPKMTQAAYLKARSSNTGAYPFLAGRANIYLDGSYVTASQLEFVPPGEDFWIFLGVDRSITVAHELVERMESSEGFRGRKKRYTYEYLLTVKNTHDREEEFIIWDQLPISSHEEIKVKLLEPRFSENTEALTLDDSQRLQWLRTLAPGEELKIPFSFYIEMPEGMHVQGIN